MSAPLVQCVERRTSTPEARVQVRVAVTQIIYSLAATVLWHKEDFNMVRVMYPGLTALECIAAILDNEKYINGPL